ncbi:hypothetical protein EC991_000419 [Linnemannia zychae]|nr:hypothetical protein EC991_000419 [Linnemannia zychae]
MRRYRRGVAVSSFALESFITIPSDKDVYHQILDSWRASGADSEEPHDVIVLDQDMKAGDEEHGRSATAAWTLLNVLERGGSQSEFGGANTRIWYLEGGFDAFQAWDANEKFLVRAGGVQPASPNLKPCGAQAEQDVEMSLAVPTGSVSAPVSRRPSLAIDTSVSFAPKAKTPVRRESLFSLNTKALQRPAGLSRSQTVNLKPLTISTQPAAGSLSIQIPHTPSSALPHQQQASCKNATWLTVPSSIPAPALSPAMSMASNCSMEIAHSASTDHTSSWSADSNSMNGSNHFLPSMVNNSLGLSLSSKRSVSSLMTVGSMHASTSCASASILEEDEEHAQYRSMDSHHVSSDGDDHHSQHRFTGYPRRRDSFQYASDFSHQDGSDCAEDGQDDGEQEISCILPGFLYLGPEIVTKSQVEELDRLGVKRILNMATECEDVLVAQRPGMEYHKIGVHDHVEADVSAGLLQAVDIISASKDSAIYVHCKAGKSRSVTATIAYLISQLQWPLNKAYQHVLTQRPCMCPNLGFVAELIQMEKHFLGADKALGLQLQLN